MNLAIYLTDHLGGVETACDVLAQLARQYPNGDPGHRHAEEIQIP